MTDAWPRLPVSAVVDILSGGTPKRSVPEYWGGDIQWASAKDIANAPGRKLHNASETITEAGLNNSATRFMPSGTIIITARGTVGAMAQLGAPMAFNQTCYAIIPSDDQVDNDYLFYALSATFRNAAALSHGTIFQTITTSTFDHWEIPVPPMGEQRRIAGVLGCLDDKIELNRRMAETLEEMARALFRSWFVDFEPVRAKQEGRWRSGESLPGLPAQLYESFSDRLEPSPLGPIPAGWQVAALGDIADAPRRGIKPDEIDASTPYIGLEHMPRRSIALGEWETAAKVASGKSAFQRGEILFGKLRPYFHKVGVAPLDGICSTDIIAIEPKAQEWASFVLFVVSSDEFVAYANQTSTGTRMPRTSWKAMSAYPIALPSAPIAQAFEDAVCATTERIAAQIHESQCLAAQRDALLPALMSAGSGQVTSYASIGPLS